MFMLLRVFSFLILLFFCSSCNFFSFKKKNNINLLDTVVNFSSVDTSPSFSICDSIINKAKKTNCFRSSMHKLLTKELSSYKFVIYDSIDETVKVKLIISSKGEIVFKELASSKRIKNDLPQLDSLIRNAVVKLPKIYPAIKRGIPVITQYELPIRIKLKK